MESKTGTYFREAPVHGPERRTAKDGSAYTWQLARRRKRGKCRRSISKKSPWLCLTTQHEALNRRDSRSEFVDYYGDSAEREWRQARRAELATET